MFGTTAAVWVAVCGLILRHLMRGAASAPPGTIDDYARRPSFQLLNFAATYLPILVLLLGVVLGVEHIAIRIAERSPRRAEKV